MPYYLEKPDGLTIQVRVQPKSSKNQLDGVVGDHLRIRLTAPPVEGAANEACVRFIAELLGTPRSRVALVGGQKSREKMLHVSGVPAELKRKLEAVVAGHP